MTTDITRTDTHAAAERKTRGRLYRPLTDIVETAEGISMMLEMPGVAPDSVEVTLDKRVLTIRGTVTCGRPEGFDLAHAEYGEGDYERAFVLSEDFDPDRITAEMRAGVLTLTLPRAEAAQPRKIAVQAA